MKPSTQQRGARRIQWLDTGGGPFVLLSSSTLPEWGGVRGAGDPNEFERACDVSNYIGSIAFADSEVLVLGDDPFPTAFLASPAFGGGYIIRMLWGDDMEKASAAAHKLPAEAWTTESLVFDAGRGGLVLFDAAHSGIHAPHRIDVPLGPGRYAVATADWEDDSMCLLIHRLLPLA